MTVPNWIAKLFRLAPIDSPAFSEGYRPRGSYGINPPEPLRGQRPEPTPAPPIHGWIEIKGKVPTEGIGGFPPAPEITTVYLYGDIGSRGKKLQTAGVIDGQTLRNERNENGPLHNPDKD